MDVFIIGPGVIWFENFHICFSSFVLVHSDARANLKPNHDVNDGFGMSCFEPSHFTKSECGSGKIRDLPSEDITFFLTISSSISSRLYLCILWQTLWRSGVLHWILGIGRCDTAGFDSFGLPLEPSSSHLFILHPGGDRGCRYL